MARFWLGPTTAVRRCIWFAGARYWTLAMLRLLESPAPPELPDKAGDARACSDDPLRALAARARSGDPAAEHTLLVAVGPAILRVVRRMLGAHHPEVRDTCQEASMALLSALPSFRGECSTLHFACRVAVLTSTNARRRAQRRRLSAQPLEEEYALDEFVDEAPSPAALADAARRRAIVRELLDELPLPQAEALSLHVILGHTIEETAAAVGARPNAVRSRLQRALLALRQRINAESKWFELMGEAHD